MFLSFTISLPWPPRTKAHTARVHVYFTRRPDTKPSVSSIPDGEQRRLPLGTPSVPRLIPKESMRHLANVVGGCSLERDIHARLQEPNPKGPPARLADGSMLPRTRVERPAFPTQSASCGNPLAVCSGLISALEPPAGIALSDWTTSAHSRRLTTREDAKGPRRQH